ncbi:hypothetical protein STENM327S_08724 [Streptomyces tendae]
MTTQIFLASTLYGTATLAAALDSGCFGPADRRILLVSNNAATPETTPSLDATPGFERLRGRFDDVVSWNEAIYPFHPGDWSPRAGDVPLWERHLRLAWGLGDDDVALTVESVHVPPALGVAQIFTDAPLTVYADGLMSYGPTRTKLAPLVGTRVERLLHLDKVASHATAAAAAAPPAGAGRAAPHSPARAGRDPPDHRPDSQQVARPPA